MPFDWRDNLALARALETAAPTLAAPPDALRRCIISRAYYAAYGHAFQYATAYLGFRGRASADDHGGLRAHLRRCRRAAVSNRLNDLRDWRNACDYDAALPPEELPDTVARAFYAAQYVIDALPPPAPTNP
jgi:hypothetical protein